MTLNEAQQQCDEAEHKLRLLEQVVNDAAGMNNRIGAHLVDEESARSEWKQQMGTVELARRILQDRRESKRALELEIAKLQAQLNLWRPDRAERLLHVADELSKLQSEIGRHYPLLADSLRAAALSVGTVTQQYNALAEQLRRTESALNRLLS